MEEREEWILNKKYFFLFFCENGSSIVIYSSMVSGPWAIILSCSQVLLLYLLIDYWPWSKIRIYSPIEMDITIKVKDRSGKMYSQTFIGDKEQILPLMQDYIKDNQHHYVDIFFSTEEESKSFTYDELFNPK